MNMKIAMNPFSRQILNSEFVQGILSMIFVRNSSPRYPFADFRILFNSITNLKLNRNFMNINFYTDKGPFKYEIPIRSVAISSEVLTFSAETYIILCKPDKDALH